jgi:hypothetical protein
MEEDGQVMEYKKHREMIEAKKLNTKELCCAVEE